jgi:D-alanyl-D-alanine carboxypeptidase
MLYFDRKHLYKFVLASAVGFCLLAASIAFAKSPSADEAIYDAAVSSLYKPDEPGVTIIVTKDGKTVFRRAYGLADVEKKTLLTPEVVMRIGSVTKQFTAVAILMLEEQGKLSVQDEITKHLPDYPTHGAKITIEHLLTHTSGIPSYTSASKYVAEMAKDRSVAEMIDTFKNAKLDFAPGSKFEYNNSGYFLLGAVIEKTSGMKYADFLAGKIFEPLGMKDTAYEGFERSGGGKRIEGHSRGAKGVERASPVSMTQPYAAGSLISTVDDLARWDAAISSGKLLKADNWKRAFTSYTLGSGKKTDYGYGWFMGKSRGRDSIEHGGSINGFVTQGLRVPSENVYVAVLSNTNAPGAAPSYVAEKLAAIAMNDPYPEFKSVSLDVKIMDEIVGVYKIDEKSNRVISREGDMMFLQRTGRPKLRILAASATEYFVENTFTSMRFVKDSKGEVTSMVMTQGGRESTSPRASKEAPKGRTAISMTAAQFDPFVGEYQLAPTFSIVVSRDGEKFLAQATGQSTAEIFPESPTKFFYKIVDAHLSFTKDASGKITGLVLHQNGRDTPGKKVM